MIGRTYMDVWPGQRTRQQLARDVAASPEGPRETVFASSQWRRELPHDAHHLPGVVMHGFVQNIEQLARDNTDFRRVLYTAEHCQLVLMTLEASEEIGEEVHGLDQFFRVEEGNGVAVLKGVSTAIRPGFAVLVPAGTLHNIINPGPDPLKLYTIYSPPNHRDGVVHATRADAEADSEHFDGKTTEGPDVELTERQGEAHPVS